MKRDGRHAAAHRVAPAHQQPATQPVVSTWLQMGRPFACGRPSSRSCSSADALPARMAAS